MRTSGIALIGGERGMAVREFGPYRLQAMLGSGGMGEVYRAHDTRRDREVAIKLLPELFSGDEEYQHRFRRESQVAARLREPHVIPIHDFGEIDGRLYIDMRLVDGVHLGAVLDRGRLPPQRAVALIGQVADALDAAHEDGLVHRDVKPSNVLVTPADFVYVVDFGIARSIGTAGTALTMTGAAVGTLDYMAPERFTMGGIDARTDVYSLACVLYEVLTGSRPFTGNDLPSLMYAHLYTEPPQPSRVVANLPAALDAVIARGMAKRPEDRHPSAGALARAAREALVHAPARAEVPGPRTASPGVSSTIDIGHPAVPRPRPPAAEPRPAAPQPRARVPHQRGGPGRVPAADEPTRDVPRPRRPDEPARLEALPPGPPPMRKRVSNALLVVAVAVVVGLVAVLIVVLVRPGAGGQVPSGSGTSATVPPPVIGVPSAPPVPADQIAASIAVPTVGESIPVGPTPGYLHMAPNGRFAYIAGREAGVITVLDTTIDKVTATIPVPQGPPQFVAFSPNGDRAYVSVFNKDLTINLVVFVNTATNAIIAQVPVGKKPYASATTPDGRLLYVPSHDEGRLDVIDTTTGQETTRIPVPRNPHWVAFGKDGRFIYTANHESGVVTVLDAADNSIVTQIGVGVSPHSTAVSPDGSRVSVVNYDSNEVSVIDTATNTVVATVPVGKKPQDIAYAPDGRFMYTANVDDDTVSVISAETDKVTATIPIGDGPTSVAVTPNGRRAYVTDLNEGSVRVLDIAAV
jgi:serine/threonine-protein kinase